MKTGNYVSLVQKEKLTDFSCMSSVLGLICYQCHSTESWDRCRTTTKTCPASKDRCGKVQYKVDNVDHFRKDCIPKSGCVKDGNFWCTRHNECDVNCCDGNDCNVGSLFLISGILFLTCAVISVVSLTNT